MYLDYYENIRISGDNNRYSISDSIDKDFYIFIHSLFECGLCKDTLNMAGYHDDRFAFGKFQNNHVVDFSKLFAKYSSYFLINDSEIEYVSMTPIDIFIPVMEKFAKNSIYTHYFDTGLDELKDMFYEYNDKIKQEDREDLERRVYAGLPINVRAYLEKASSIRTDLLENYSNVELFQNVEKDSIPISLILAVSAYSDLLTDEYGITMQSCIKKVLMDKNLLTSPEKSATNYKFSSTFDSDIYIIYYLFRKYYEHGIEYHATNNRSEITVQDIIDYVINHHLNSTLVVDRLMDHNKCIPESLKSFPKLVEEEYRKQRLERELKYTSKIYDNLKNDSIEYLELATKIYTLIQEKMKSNKHNTEVLNKEDDLDTLSLFIASFYYDLDVAKFYKKYDINLDKIFRFLKLNITQEEIDNQPLNKKLLVDKFEKFINKGVNQDKNVSSITPSSINHNLCNREFNKSTIMENIFYGLTDNFEISKDFLNQIKNELAEAKKIEQDRKRKELFEDMDMDTIKYLKRLSRVYKSMKYSSSKMKDYKTYSILMSLEQFIDNNIYIETLHNNGLSLRDFNDTTFFDYSVLSIIRENENKIDNVISDIDVDFLLDNFKDLIFDENNKKRNIIEMIKCIPSYCDSLTMLELYSRFNIDSTVFTDIEKNIEKELEHKKEIEKEEKAKKNFTSINNYSENVLYSALKMFEYLKTKNIQNINKEDLPDLAVLLSLLNSNYNQFFESNNLTLDLVCKTLKINKRELTKVDKKIEYLPRVEDFKKYLLKLNGDPDTFEYFKKIFFNDNKPLEYIIDKINAEKGEEFINKALLKQEVINEKSFMDSLSLDEKISLLEKHEIEPVNSQELSTVLSFGNSLGVHSKYIYSELPKLASNHTFEDSMESINSLIEKVYDKKEVKKGFFKNLFTKKGSNVEIDLDALAELRRAIDENIKVLSEELEAYDKIRLYLEAYRSKNREYLSKANQLVDDISEELDVLNPEIDEQFDKYVYLKGLLEMTRNKVEMFNTTNVIARQELLRISQASVTHSLAIDALRLSQKDLFPFIGEEYALSKGGESEKRAFELSKNVMDLFETLLHGNIEDSAKKLALIKATEFPQNFLGYQNINEEDQVKKLELTKQANTPVLDFAYELKKKR